MANNYYFRLFGGRMISDIQFDHTLIPSVEQKAAMVGTDGSPGSGNPFVTDSDGRIPTTDEKAGLAGVSGHPPSASDPFGTESFIRGLIDGLDWQESITHGLDYVKAGTPIGAGAAEGEKCLDTTNKKLHTFTTGAWDAGIAITNLRFCHNTTGQDTGGDAGTHTKSDKIYRADASDNITEIIPTNGAAALFEDEDNRRQYNGSSWILFDSGSSHNSLSGIQGGNGTDQYYHMTSDEDAALAGAADALSSSNPVLGKTDKARVPVRYSYVYRGGVGQSQTDVAMFDDNDLRSSGVVMHKAGYVVGLVLQSSSPRTAGTLTVKPGKNGSAMTDTSLNTVLDGSNTDKNYANAAEGVSGLDFIAGDNLQPLMTTDATWATSAGSENISSDLLVVFS